MNLRYKELLPPDFAPSSRVWIYQASRLFTLQEALRVEGILQEFVNEWRSHGDPVKGYANLFFGQFIILMADESATSVGGCSTDSSVRLVKQIEEEFKVPLFDRQLLAFLVKDKIQMIPLSQMEYAVQHNFIQADTPYFNNTVMTKAELESAWIQPVRDSWLASRLHFSPAL